MSEKKVSKAGVDFKGRNYRNDIYQEEWQKILKESNSPDELENNFEKIKEEVNEKFNAINSKVENSYINIIQIIALVVSVLALVMGNILGFISLPEDIIAINLIGYLFLINGIILTSISFFIFIIKYLFFKNDWKYRYLLFFVIPFIFQYIGYRILK